MGAVPSGTGCGSQRQPGMTRSAIPPRRCFDLAEMAYRTTSSPRPAVEPVLVGLPQFGDPTPTPQGSCCLGRDRQQHRNDHGRVRPSASLENPTNQRFARALTRNIRHRRAEDRLFALPWRRTGNAQACGKTRSKSAVASPEPAPRSPSPALASTWQQRCSLPSDGGTRIIQNNHHQRRHHRSP